MYNPGHKWLKVIFFLSNQGWQQMLNRLKRGNTFRSKHISTVVPTQIRKK